MCCDLVKMGLKNFENLFRCDNKSPCLLYPDCSKLFFALALKWKDVSLHIFSITARGKKHDVCCWPKITWNPNNIWVVDFYFFLEKVLLRKWFFWELKIWSCHCGPRRENSQISISRQHLLQARLHIADVSVNLESGTEPYTVSAKKKGICVTCCHTQIYRDSPVAL